MLTFLSKQVISQNLPLLNNSLKKILYQIIKDQKTIENMLKHSNTLQLEPSDELFYQAQLQLMYNDTKQLFIEIQNIDTQINTILNITK